ncbi:alcohol dehydrogenase [Flexivirga endophytica]|nr:alcohol dehydrogenase [Flexivirga endophytica]
MAAVRVHGWGEPPVAEEVSTPEVVADEALVRIEAAAVGHLDRTVAGGDFGVKPRLPYIGGVEGCGTVVSSALHAAGTRVMLRGGGLGLTRDGTWAEFVRVPEKNLVVLPDGMGPALGATYFVPVTTAACALRSIGRLGTWGVPDVESAADEVVLVAGAAGAVGSMVAQLALRDGAKVLGLVLDQGQADRLPDGVEPVLAGDAKHAHTLHEERPGTLLVDTLGGRELGDRMHWVRPGGRAVLIGYVTGEEATLDLPNWLLQDVALLPTNMIRRNREARKYAEELAPLLVSGDLQLAVEEFGFDQAATVFERMAAGGINGRAVLQPRSGRQESES